MSFRLVCSGFILFGLLGKVEAQAPPSDDGKAQSERSERRVTSVKSKKGQGTIDTYKVQFEFRENGEFAVSGELQGEGKWSQDGSTVSMQTSVSTFQGKIANGKVSGVRKRKDGSEADTEWAIALDDAAWKASQNRGWEAFKKKQYADAEEQFRQATSELVALDVHDGRLAQSLHGLAASLDLQDRLPQAEETIRRAVEVAKQSNAEASVKADCLLSMSEILEVRGKFKDLEETENQILKLRQDRLPNSVGLSYLRLAELCATLPEASFRDGKRALEYAKKAGEIYKWKYSACFEALAAAYAEDRDFDKAVLCQSAAVDLAPEASKDLYRIRLELYANEKPYRRPSKDRELGAPVGTPKLVMPVPPFDITADNSLETAPSILGKKYGYSTKGDGTQVETPLAIWFQSDGIAWDDGKLISGWSWKQSGSKVTMVNNSKNSSTVYTLSEDGRLLSSDESKETLVIQGR